MNQNVNQIKYGLIYQIKSWLEKKEIEMFSKYKEKKSVAAERFIRTLKNKIYKIMTSISKNLCIDKLDYLVNKHNNAYNSTIKTKRVDVIPNTYIESSKKITQYPKFKIGDIDRISKQKKNFVKVYVPDWS